MQAVVLRGTGGPDVLTVEDVPKPAPARDEILVRTEAIGVSTGETRMRSGAIPLPFPLPVVFGAEAVGIVVDAGTDVDQELRGRRVAFVTGGRGSYAEYVAARAAMATVVPDGVAPVEAVAAAASGAMAIGLLHRAGLSSGETVLVEAASSAVGSHLVQQARDFGAGRIVTTAGSAAKRECARGLGADIVLDHYDPAWPDLLREALGGAALDVAFASIGGTATGRVVELLTPSTGRMLVYGNLSGEPPTADLARLARSGASIVGCGGPGWADLVFSTGYPEILTRLAGGRATALVDTTFALADAAKAHQRIEDGTALGKVVLVP